MILSSVVSTRRNNTLMMQDPQKQEPQEIKAKIARALGGRTEAVFKGDLSSELGRFCGFASSNKLTTDERTTILDSLNGNYKLTPPLSADTIGSAANDLAQAVQKEKPDITELRQFLGELKRQMGGKYPQEKIENELGDFSSFCSFITSNNLTPEERDAVVGAINDRFEVSFSAGNIRFAGNALAKAAQQKGPGITELKPFLAALKEQMGEKYPREKIDSVYDDTKGKSYGMNFNLYNAENTAAFQIDRLFEYMHETVTIFPLPADQALNTGTFESKVGKWVDIVLQDLTMYDSYEKNRSLEIINKILKNPLTSPSPEERSASSLPTKEQKEDIIKDLTVNDATKKKFVEAITNWAKDQANPFERFLAELRAQEGLAPNNWLKTYNPSQAYPPKRTGAEAPTSSPFLPVQAKRVSEADKAAFRKALSTYFNDATIPEELLDHNQILAEFIYKKFGEKSDAVENFLAAAQSRPELGADHPLKHYVPDRYNHERNREISFEVMKLLINDMQQGKNVEFTERILTKYDGRYPFSLHGCSDFSTNSDGIQVLNRQGRPILELVPRDRHDAGLVFLNDKLTEEDREDLIQVIADAAKNDPRLDALLDLINSRSDRPLKQSPDGLIKPPISDRQRELLQNPRKFAELLDTLPDAPVDKSAQDRLKQFGKRLKDEKAAAAKIAALFGSAQPSFIGPVLHPPVDLTSSQPAIDLLSKPPFIGPVLLDTTFNPASGVTPPPITSKPASNPATESRPTPPAR